MSLNTLGSVSCMVIADVSSSLSVEVLEPNENLFLLKQTTRIIPAMATAATIAITINAIATPLLVAADFEDSTSAGFGGKELVVEPSATVAETSPLVIVVGIADIVVHY